MTSLTFKRTLLSLALLACAAASQAGSIELSPVRVNLGAATKMAVLTVRNTGAEESVMQVTLNKWTLNGQSYAYAQSQELVVTPATFKLAPGGQQIVRIGLRNAPPATREAAYRLLVEEVPPPPTPGVTQTRLVVRHDLPVFVAPTQAAKAALDVTMECAADGARLRLKNVGNVHAQLRSVALEASGDKAALGRWEAFDYLLPDARKDWRLADVAAAAAGKSFKLTAATDQGDFTSDVSNSCK
jgi:fimbrial chaperone protein